MSRPRRCALTIFLVIARTGRDKSMCDVIIMTVCQQHEFKRSWKLETFNFFLIDAVVRRWRLQAPLLGHILWAPRRLQPSTNSPAECLRV